MIFLPYIVFALPLIKDLIYIFFWKGVSILKFKNSSNLKGKMAIFLSVMFLAIHCEKRYFSFSKITPTS